MIIVLKANTKRSEIEELQNIVTGLGLKGHLIEGSQRTVMGLVGNTKEVRRDSLELLPYVEKVLSVLQPFKLVSREVKPDDTVIEIGEIKIGGKEVVMMAGPCAIESYDQLLETAKFLQGIGVKILRGGAYKPRTSPYSFQGLGEQGLEILSEISTATGLLTVSEVVEPADVETVANKVDILQVGARNMQNFRLLKSIGASGKPVLLKRGISATIEEWLMAAEYIASEGNRKIILCERGIRTYETMTRNTLDISAVPVVKQLSHLPVIVDPSHSSGNWRLVSPLSKGAVATGADGLIIEVHRDPKNALSDGAQSLNHDNFARLYAELKPVAEAVGRVIV